MEFSVGMDGSSLGFVQGVFLCLLAWLPGPRPTDYASNEVNSELKQPASCFHAKRLSQHLGNLLWFERKEERNLNSHLLPGGRVTCWVDQYS